MASTSEEPVNREQKPVNRKQTPEVQERMYKTKVIQFLGKSTPIILQNENGPCALIAICNVLSLRNKLGLKPDVKKVSQERLYTLVAERLIATCKNNKNAVPKKNQLQRVSNAIDLIAAFARGINVDIKFKSINDVELTRERDIFDLLRIPLYHGWIVDPKHSDTANAIGTKSYNELMDELVALKTRSMDKLKITETVDSCPKIIPGYDRLTFETDSSSHDAKLVSSESGKHDSVSFEIDPGKDVGSSLETEKASHCESQKHESCSSAPNVVQESSKDTTDGITAIQGKLIRNFLENNASQLTKYGLYRLTWYLHECELCVLFRNNHFNTMFKYQGKLFTLVTDRGYSSTPGVIWEKLHQINHTFFANSRFRIHDPHLLAFEDPSDEEEEDNANLPAVFEFLANPNKTAELENKCLTSDMQILEELEQDKLEQQSKRDPPATSPSGLIVGPKQNNSPMPGPQSASSKKDSKRKRVKEKCNLM